jgi:hypothetical protein
MTDAIFTAWCLFALGLAPMAGRHLRDHRR